MSHLCTANVLYFATAIKIKYNFRYYDTITLSETIRSLNYMGATTNTPDALIVSNLKIMKMPYDHPKIKQGREGSSYSCRLSGSNVLGVPEIDLMLKI